MAGRSQLNTKQTTSIWFLLQDLWPRYHLETWLNACRLNFSRRAPPVTLFWFQFEGRLSWTWTETMNLIRKRFLSVTGSVAGILIQMVYTYQKKKNFSRDYNYMQWDVIMDKNTLICSRYFSMRAKIQSPIIFFFRRMWILLHHSVFATNENRCDAIFWIVIS